MLTYMYTYMNNDHIYQLDVIMNYYFSSRIITRTVINKIYLNNCGNYYNYILQHKTL